MKVKIVIDVEMCLVQKSYEWKDYPYEHEIIQIGAVMMKPMSRWMNFHLLSIRDMAGSIILSES